jgi:hypothetical protein
MGEFLAGAALVGFIAFALYRLNKIKSEDSPSHGGSVNPPPRGGGETHEN